MTTSVAGLVGCSTTFAKTVSESDVYLFAGITGDFSPNHVNHEAMSQSPIGERIAHGVLTLGFMSTCSSKFVELTGAVAVSVGYDRVRFVAPVFIGDTIDVLYTVVSADDDRRRTTASVTVHTQEGRLCAVATHILKFTS